MTTTIYGVGLWIDPDHEVTVERPVPSDPIGTVRGQFIDYQCASVYRKANDEHWFCDTTRFAYFDADVADFPILWKPGMPIPTETKEQ